MRWIVGIDFKGRCNGALRFAAWLQRNAQVGGPQEMIGVHAMPEQLRRVLVRDAGAELGAAALVQMDRVAAELSDGAPQLELRAQWAGSSDEGLMLASADAGITGIIVGRASRRRSGSFDRLGRVTRRLLRRLPAPVMVVPPDLQLGQIAGGPIALATDLGDASAPAARLALALARVLDRELLVLNVDSTLYDAAIIAPETVASVASLPRRTIAEVEAWAAANELGTPTCEVGQGERVSTLLRLASAREAAIVVCGSRCLSTAERIFASSTGSELARHADRPVLVVPSTRNAA